jgi:DNA-binding MarR family transcriptional regulator
MPSVAKALDPSSLEGVCNATAIRKASRRMTQFYDSALEPSGLRSTQFAILYQLGRPSGSAMTMGELADALVLDRSALGHNLRPLLREGLIALQESAIDRRRTNVVVTPLGRAKTREATKLWQLAQNQFETRIGKAEAAQIRKTMLTIAHLDSFALAEEKKRDYR